MTETPPPPPAPWYQGLEGVDSELTGHIQTKGWDKITPAAAAAAAARAHRESERLVGAPADKIIRLPNDPKDEAGMKAVWQRLGTPADAKDYDFSTLKTADGKEPDKALLDFARDQAFKLNMPKDAAVRLAEAMLRQTETNATSQKAEYTANLAKEQAALDANWGADKDAKMFVAKKAANALGVTNEEVTALEKVVGYKRVMDMFLAVGQKIGEDKFIAGGGGPNNGGLMTADQAAARMIEMKSDTAWRERYFAGGAAEKREFEAVTTIIAAAKSASNRS